MCSLQVYKKKSKSVCCGNTNNNYNDTTTVLSVCLLFLCITENVFWKLRGVGAAAPHGKEKKLKKNKNKNLFCEFEIVLKAELLTTGLKLGGAAVIGFLVPFVIPPTSLLRCIRCFALVALLLLLLFLSCLL